MLVGGGGKVKGRSTYGEKVDPTKDEDEDARADDDTPECHAEFILTA